MNEELKKLMDELENFLDEAPEEDECTYVENDMYDEMANLKMAIREVLEEREC